MNKIFSKISILIFGCLLVVCALTTFASNKENVSTPIRDVELVKQNVDMNSYFEKFDSYNVKVDDNISIFEGVSTFRISDFADIDNVNGGDVSETATLKFTSSFDYDLGITTLNVLLVEEEEVSIIDTIYGVAVIADTGEVDVVFDFDGELIFLSELRNTGAIDNVGWFKNLIKKAVSSVVSTVEATVKVLSTSNGFVGTACTLVACAGVGALCAFIPGGQIVTTVCAGIAGSIVGGVGFNLTAKAAQLQNSSITDEDIKSYTTLGTIVGSTVAVATGSAVNAVRASQKALELGKKTFTSSEKLLDHYEKHNSEFGGIYNSLDDYLNGANYVIENGQYVSEMNGYIRFFGANGKANYAFVGLTADGSQITTFGIRSVSELSKVIPWLVR